MHYTLKTKTGQDMRYLTTQTSEINTEERRQAQAERWEWQEESIPALNSKHCSITLWTNYQSSTCACQGKTSGSSCAAHAELICGQIGHFTSCYFNPRRQDPRKESVLCDIN